jgi:hypothetical protein
MKKLVVLLVLVIVGVVIVYMWKRNNVPRVEVPKQQPVAQSKYSVEFNQSVNKVLEEYYGLSHAFVTWDSNQVNTESADLKKAIAELNFDEIKKDTVIHETATSYIQAFEADIQGITGTTDFTEKRRAFNGLSQNLYDLLRTVKFDASKVYLQECPMAFNDTEAAIWLSKTAEINNPYMGMHHPKYKSGMLQCGETKDSLSFGGGN